MDITRTDEKLIKDIEEWNKQEKTITFNDNPSVVYFGIFELLDEIIKRIKEVKLIDRTLVDDYCETFIKVYRELKELKGDDKSDN